MEEVINRFPNELTSNREGFKIAVFLGTDGNGGAIWRNISEKDLLKVMLKESVMEMMLVVFWWEIDRFLQKTKVIFHVRLVVVLVWVDAKRTCARKHVESFSVELQIIIKGNQKLISYGIAF